MQHRVDQLQFLLVRGKADLTPLRIFDSRRIDWRGFAVSFYVLGASHAVCIENRGRETVFEILSCVAVDGVDKVISAPLDAPGTVCAIVDNLNYRCELSPFALEGWLDSFATEYPADNQLRFAYDARHKGDAAPLTYVAWRPGPDLIVETVHTYPEEGRGVRSLSRLSLLADAG